MSLCGLVAAWGLAANHTQKIVAGNNVIRILTPTMFSVAPCGAKNLPSVDLGVSNNAFGTVSVTVDRRAGGNCIITTDSVVIIVDPSKNVLDGGLMVKYRRLPAYVLNGLSAHDDANLGGVIGSLDNCKGNIKYAEQNDVASKSELHPIPDGILSRRGFTVLRHTTDTLALYRSGNRYAELYVLAYGNNFRQAFSDFYALAGTIPMLPEWSFGFIYSRWKDYTAGDYKKIVARFRQERIPIDAIILDMCWHVDYWYGYRYDTDNFPDMKAFHLWTDSVHVKTGFNHHSGCVYSKDPHINEFCRKAGLDYDKALIPGLSWEPDKKVIHYDTRNKRQFKAFYDIYLAPLIKDGLDFHWVDGEKSIYSSELYQTYLSRETHKRPFVLNRLHDDVLCNHRYPAGFSGDTYISWETMAYSLEADIKGANCGVYWSHDIGGYMPQGPAGYPPSAEMFARWLQLGAVSPIFRVHAKKDVYWTPPCKPGEFDQGSRLPWEWGDTILASAKTSVRLRYQLLPYIYSMAWQAHTSGVPLCRGLYIDYPDETEAYRYDEFKFGDNLLAAPIMEPAPAGAANMTATRTVWLPAGEWYDYFSHQRLNGACIVKATKPVFEFPLYVRAGAIIPQAPYRDYSAVPLDTVNLVIFAPSKDMHSRFGLYEDDGESFEFQQKKYRITPLMYEFRNGCHTVVIAGASGRYDGQVENRVYNVVIECAGKPSVVKVNGVNSNLWKRNDSTGSITVSLPSADVYHRQTVEIECEK
jgi:alpha-glucosidase (family GH31 glycosyl hydrolase)